MNPLVRILPVAVAALVLAWLWHSAWPDLFRAGVPSITEDAEFALLVRLTGFVVLLAIAFWFAARNLMKK
ncbi:MAG: hypothetical protein MUF17_00455 [Syntrophales bacterium]|jgi:hypothetical protein|nr:hypothetical protein [Syntrophales bacterium]